MENWYNSSWYLSSLQVEIIIIITSLGISIGPGLSTMSLVAWSDAKAHVNDNLRAQARKAVTGKIKEQLNFEVQEEWKIQTRNEIRAEIER